MNRNLVTEAGYTFPDLNKMAQSAAFTRKDKGFGTDLVNIDQKLLLSVGEICEAQEELRSGHDPTEIYYNADKPEGFPIEIADTLIRLLDVTNSLGIDIVEAVKIKMAYNATRPFKHGKKF